MNAPSLPKYGDVVTGDTLSNQLMIVDMEDSKQGVVSSKDLVECGNDDLNVFNNPHLIKYDTQSNTTVIQPHSLG